MEDNNRKLSPFWFAFIGLVVTALIGLAVSYLLLGKTQPYRENRLWKYTVLLYFISMVYTIWYYFSEDYLPILINLLKCVGLNFILSLPYFTILIYIGDFSVNSILTILPAQIIFLAAIFIWHVASEIDPELEENTDNIWGAKNTIPAIILFAFIMILFEITVYEITEAIWLALFCLMGLVYSVFLLFRAKIKIRNKVLESHPEDSVKTESD